MTMPRDEQFVRQIVNAVIGADTAVKADQYVAELLQARADAAEAKLAEQQAELISLRELTQDRYAPSTYHELEAKLAAVEQEHARLTKVRDDWRDNCDGIGKMLDAAEASLTAAHQERDAAQAQCASAERELNEAWKQLTAAHQQIAEIVREMMTDATAISRGDRSVIEYRIDKWAAALESLIPQPSALRSSEKTTS